ncbi:MAG: hypothetical protein ACRD7E_13285 [Bryobacteraceae bacterium]
MKTPGHVVPAQNRLLGDQMLVSSCEPVVTLNLFFGFGIYFDQIPFDDFGQIGEAHPAAGESEGVMNQNDVSAFGEIVCPGGSAIVLLLVALHYRMLILADARDLARAEVFVAAMVMQPEHTRQAAFRTGRLQQHRLGRRSIGELPAQMFYGQSVIFDVVLHLGARR